MKIYEIRDETDSDRYYSLRLFETLDAAKQAILEIPQDCRISDTDDDYEKIAVYERNIGWYVGNYYRGGGRNAFSYIKRKPIKVVKFSHPQFKARVVKNGSKQAKH